MSVLRHWIIWDSNVGSFETHRRYILQKLYNKERTRAYKTVVGKCRDSVPGMLRQAYATCATDWQLEPQDDPFLPKRVLKTKSTDGFRARK